nr:MAG TPA: YopX protein [Caudoviricetes sp.]DAP01870.1 MAG TPA: YopX protein [Caudoviricetes sp.]
MREIIFKAKRLDNGEWVEGSLISFADGGRAILPSKSAALYKKGASLFSTVNCLEVDPSTVCQYTGLTDKNGKKIFEGDNVYDPHENSIYTVEWNENNAIFQMAHDWRRRSVETAYYCEIIGNIHDGEGNDDD